jgi:integrase
MNSNKRGVNMAGHNRGRGSGIIEDPRRPGKLYLRIWHHGRKYNRRVESISHGRRLHHEIKALISRGEWPPKPEPKAVLFDELFEDYRDVKRLDGKSVMASGIGYRRLIERFGGKRADEIATVEVDKWRRELEEIMAPASVNLHLCLLRAILRHGLRSKKLSVAALPEIDALKTNNQRVRYLTEDEENRLVGALPEWLRPLVIVAIHTGMRRGELLKLLWDDVDFVQSVIWVRVSKSGEGRRISMNATVHRTLSILRDERRMRLSQKVVAQNVAQRNVFTAPAGGFVWNLARVWYRAVNAAGISNLHFHDLRHTFASRLAMRHIDLNTIRVLLGHKSLAMTYRYAHFDPEYLAAAVATLDAPGPKPWAAAVESR